jgi:hypothetical protein
MGDPLVVEGDSELAAALRRDLARDPLPNVGVNGHTAPLDVTDRDSVLDWIVDRAYRHQARIATGYLGEPRPPAPPGARY